MAERFRAAFDGGSRGNPGPAAWAVVVLDEQGRSLETHACALEGDATNNVAEYHGLIEALRLARGRASTIYSDSELIVRQIQGRYRVKSTHLKPLYARARALIERMPDFRIVHVARGRNREADRLVNRVLDQAQADPQCRGRRHRESSKPSIRAH